MRFWRQTGACFLIILSLLSAVSVSLDCYLCSYFENNECPNNQTDPETWAQNSTKYTEVGSSKDLACSVGFAQSGKVYIQSAVPKSLCDTAGFKNALIIRINKVPEIGGAVICCTNSGCNWNQTTAEQDISYAEITQKFYAIVAKFGWTPIIIVIVVAAAILFCCIGLCCFLCCSKKRKGKQTDSGKSSQIPTNPFVNPAKKDDVKRIEVKPKISSRDHERYSAIDRKLYRRPETNPSPVVDTNRNYRSGNQDNFYDPMTGKSKERIGAISKDIFSNEDFREANMAIVDAKSKQPENKDWVNVWKTSSSDQNGKPVVAKGLTNAFQFK